MGNEVPASAALPSGHSFSRRRQSASRPRHRLRGLQMGEARHRIAGVRRGAIRQRAHHVGYLAGQSVDRIAHPQTKIHRHLVVAAARGVQASAGLADPLGEPRLDVHVDVLERRIECKASGLDLLRNRC